MRLDTEFAALEDAFEDPGLVVRRDLAFEDLEDLVLNEGLPLAAWPTDLDPHARASATLSLDADRVLYRTTDGTVLARGALRLSIADFDASRVAAEVKVADFNVGPIGAGPFGVDVRIALRLGVDGRVSGSMTYQARQEVFVRVGGRYGNGATDDSQRPVTSSIQGVGAP